MHTLSAWLPYLWVGTLSYERNKQGCILILQGKESKHTSMSTGNKLQTIASQATMPQEDKYPHRGIPACLLLSL
jgi:hypothetical protein